MSQIHIINDIPLIEDVFKYDVIIVGTGIHNALGNGFQYDIKINFPEVENMVKKTPYADSRKLGSVSILNIQPIMCVCFIHKGGYNKYNHNEYIDYESLSNALELIDKHFDNMKIATTLIGCSCFDGNGNKDKVIDIFNHLKGTNDYFIYDYEQRDYREVNNEKWHKINKLVGKIPHSELRKMKDEYIEQRKFGIYNKNKR